MSVLIELYSYHRWANRRILTACSQLNPEQLAYSMPDHFGSPFETLTHMISVETNYLRLMRGEPTRPERFALVSEALERTDAVSEEYLTLIAETSELDLTRLFRMPGLDRELSVEQGLIQVATHSTQHRADLASALTRLGQEPPALDYVQLLTRSEE